MMTAMSILNMGLEISIEEKNNFIMSQNVRIAELERQLSESSPKHIIDLFDDDECGEDSPTGPGMYSPTSVDNIRSCFKTPVTPTTVSKSVHWSDMFK
jgi:hypothetical protein